MSASGGAIPITPEYLLQALQAASSQSPELVQNASNQLKNWEKERGFWTLLQDAFLDRSLPLELRWIAVITLKQGVDKFWRKAAANSINKEEKTHIRSRLISSSIDELQPQLAVQNAVIIAKIARLEYPLDWPEVFTELTAIIRDSSQSISAEALVNGDASPLRLTRALSILLHVVKELATGRLVKTRANLQKVTPEIFKVLGRVYVQFVEVWPNLLSQQPSSPRTADVMTISLLTLKIMRRLMIAGYEFPNRMDEVVEFWGISSTQVWNFLNMESAIPGSNAAIMKLLRKHVINMGKLFHDLSTSHPAAFALMPRMLQLLGSYWEVIVAYGDMLAEQSKNMDVNGGVVVSEDSDAEERRVFREKIALQGMLLFRSCTKMIFNPVSTFKYRHQKEKDENKKATELLKTQLFTPTTIRHCMEVLVTKYFMLRPVDLEGWNEDPEAWSEQWENSVDSYEFLIRPCAEKLFMDLVVNYKSLADPLMNVFNTLPSISNDDILTKDAIYTAVGLAAPVLHPYMDFDQFLINTLVNEVQIGQQGYNILRRRTAILIGQWVSVKISEAARPVMYQIFQHLLAKEDPLNDLVVRLSAARSLKRCIYEWEFKIEGFLPFADDLFSKLMVLMDDVEQTDTRMGVLDVIGAIVERLEFRVADYAERIVRILPPLWEQTGDEHLFKQAILSIFTKLVAAMKGDSLRYHGMVVPLIRFSVQPESGMQVYLLEDALDLWDVTIKSTPTPVSQDLLDLVQYLLPCVELGTMTLKRVLDIIEGYVLLAPAEMIENYRVPMFNAFSSLLNELKPEFNGIVTNVVEIVIRAAEAMGGQQALNVVSAELVRSGFLRTVFEGIEGCWKAAQTTGPNRKYATLNPLVLTDYFMVLGRIALAGSGWFVEVIRIMAGEQGVERMMGWVLEEWFRHFGNIGHPKARKLNCLALTKLLETNERWILVKLQDLMTVWTDVIGELTEDAARENDALIYWLPDDSETPETPEKARRRQFAQSDPVHTLNVKEFVKHHLEKVQAENGGSEVFARDWLANVDKEVVTDFGKLGVYA
ncbi:hypothetical protein RUND412_009385 [Rhizina undulata]